MENDETSKRVRLLHEPRTGKLILDKLYDDGYYHTISSISFADSELRRRILCIYVKRLREDIGNKIKDNSHVYIPWVPEFAQRIAYRGYIFHRPAIKRLVQVGDYHSLCTSVTLSGSASVGCAVDPNLLLKYAEFYGDYWLSWKAISLGARNIAWGLYGAAKAGRVELCKTWLEWIAHEFRTEPDIECEIIRRLCKYVCVSGNMDMLEIVRDHIFYNDNFAPYMPNANYVVYIYSSVVRSGNVKLFVEFDKMVREFSKKLSRKSSILVDFGYSGKRYYFDIHFPKDVLSEPKVAYSLGKGGSLEIFDRIVDRNYSDLGRMAIVMGARRGGHLNVIDRIMNTNKEHFSLIRARNITEFIETGSDYWLRCYISWNNRLLRMLRAYPSLYDTFSKTHVSEMGEELIRKMDQHPRMFAEAKLKAHSPEALIAWPNDILGTLEYIKEIVRKGERFLLCMWYNSMPRKLRREEFAKVLNQSKPRPEDVAMVEYKERLLRLLSSSAPRTTTTAFEKLI